MGACDCRHLHAPEFLECLISSGHTAYAGGHVARLWQAGLEHFLHLASLTFPAASPTLHGLLWTRATGGIRKTWGCWCLCLGISSGKVSQSELLAGTRHFVSFPTPMSYSSIKASVCPTCIQLLPFQLSSSLGVRFFKNSHILGVSFKTKQSSQWN